MTLPFALGTLGLCAAGAFRSAHDKAPQLVALGGVTLLLLICLLRRLSRVAQEVPSGVVDVELGTLFVAVAMALMELTGGPSSPLYPLLFALSIFLVAFHSAWVSAYFFSLIVVTEGLITAQDGSRGGFVLFASHTAFNAFFAFLYAAFLRTGLHARRRALAAAVTSALGDIEQDGQAFRLRSAAQAEDEALSHNEANQRRLVGSVHAIRDSLNRLLGIADSALKPHTVALYWLDGDGTTLRLRGQRCHGEAVTDRPIGVREGFLGAVCARRQPLVLTALRADHPGLVYYPRPPPIRDFVGVSIVDGAQVHGVLLADRCDGVAFAPGDVAILSEVAHEIMRAVHVERVFSHLDREKYQKERFYEATRRFNQARTLQQVAEVAIDVTLQLTGVPFACLAVATDNEGELKVALARGPDSWRAKNLEGEVFSASSGLVGIALKARHPLPSGTQRASGQPILAPHLSLPASGVKVFPLLWKNLGVGAIVLGSDADLCIEAERLDMARVVADHAAIAIANAQMYERMERMATTDGLTNLVNHRHFQHCFDAALARATRYDRPLSLILTDIDHFKRINDTYGHPVGDSVLQRVADILAGTVRRTDVAARYGGEEFAVLMDETDSEGAWQMAERIRHSVAAHVFRSSQGTFRCTLSLGVATHPQHGENKSTLVAETDIALYQAKEGGRNRTVVRSSSTRSRRPTPSRAS